MLQALVSQPQANVSIFRPDNAKLCALVAEHSESRQHVRCLRGKGWKRPVASRAFLGRPWTILTISTSGLCCLGTIRRGSSRQVSLFSLGQSRRGRRGHNYGQTAINGSTAVNASLKRVARSNCRKPFPPLLQWHQCVVTGCTRR